MSTQEVADKLVAYCRHGRFSEAVEELYGQDITSIEPDGSPAKEVHGLEGVKQKMQDFNNMVEEVHGMEVSDPLVADKFFSCTMKMDVTFKGAPRSTMEEICLYKVEDGKITYEEFFFTPMGPQG
ncbi:nuclear transport factor 2 family protein [Ulvibacterium sp.]|uniref:nuclear transport factor 2 family protein n=1 Tax=Ulvibacterium sp. TaxID=2665914 RepID=UPI0026017505|nr:nuclear transport factor 2 family protein [Ulvibacterium sp.]